jgi:parvulin-like peptidyl-prolyl isomerase
MGLKRTACFVAAVAIAAGLSVGLQAEIVEQILVKVNGEIFTKTDLENAQVSVLRQRGQQVDLKNDPNNAQLRKLLDQITPEIMVSAVDQMLLVQRGKELGYRLSDDQFKSAVDSIKKENKIETDEQFQAALKQEGMTMADLRRNFERQAIRSHVEQTEVLGKVGVTDDEAKAYYDAHMSEFTTPPTISLREILVAVPTDPKGINVAADDDAKARAEKIRARAESGESFDKLATEVSDAPSKSNGGLIGPIGMDALSPDLRKVIEPLKVGQLSDVVRTARGYQVFKLDSSTPAQIMPFEQAKEQISEHVFTGKRQEEEKKYLEKLRAQAIIEFKNDDVKRAYEEGLKQQAASAATPESR